MSEAQDTRRDAAKDAVEGRGKRRANAKISLPRVLALLRPYRWQLIAAAILLVITDGLGLLYPLVIRSLLNSIRSHHNPSFLNLVVVFLLIVFVLQAVFGALQSYLVTSFGERLSFDLRTLLFRHLQRLSLSFFDSRRTGELMSRVTNDVTLLQGSLTNNVLPIVSQVVTLVGSVLIAVLINWRITLVIVVVAPIAAIVSARLGRVIRKRTRGVQEGLGEAGIILEESLSAQRVVKAFAREDYEYGRFTTRMNGSPQQALRRAVSQSLLGPINQFVGFAAVIIIIWFGGHEVLAGRLTIGDLIAFLFYMFMLVGPLIALSNLYAQIQAALAAAERVFDLLDEPVDVAVDTGQELPTISGHINFDAVSFAYAVPATSTDEAPGEKKIARPVLRDLTFEALPGQVVALVGPSGAGKTTTLNLLMRLYEIKEGGIRVDGYDIRQVTTQSLRAQVAIVPQEPLLFGDSIAENIRYRRLEATDVEIGAAAEAANALGFIEQLPGDIQSLVGERGVKLSAGQRQRITIARALLHNPRILLLDEATASLDNESDALGQDRRERPIQERPPLVVAPRLTPVERADLILVLDDGRIVERG